MMLIHSHKVTHDIEEHLPSDLPPEMRDRLLRVAIAIRTGDPVDAQRGGRAPDRTRAGDRRAKEKRSFSCGYCSQKYLGYKSGCIMNGTLLFLATAGILTAAGCWLALGYERVRNKRLQKTVDRYLDDKNNLQEDVATLEQEIARYRKTADKHLDDRLVLASSRAMNAELLNKNQELEERVKQMLSHITHLNQQIRGLQLDIGDRVDERHRFARTLREASTEINRLKDAAEQDARGRALMEKDLQETTADLRSAIEQRNAIERTAKSYHNNASALNNVVRGIKNLLDTYYANETSRQRLQQADPDRADGETVVSAVTAPSDHTDVCAGTADPVPSGGPAGSGDERVHERSSAGSGPPSIAGVPEGGETLSTECGGDHEDRGGSYVVGGPRQRTEDGGPVYVMQDFGPSE